MKEVINPVQEWFARGHEVAYAVVVATEGSGPRELGAMMAVNDAGEVAGSVSGGCVESAVVDEAGAVISQQTPQLLSYGVADELGLSVGLTCGGTIYIFVARLEPGLLWESLVNAFDTQCAFALCTVVAGSQIGAKLLVFGDATQPLVNSTGDRALDRLVSDDARRLLGQGLTQLCDYSHSREELANSQIKVFIQSFTPPPRLIIIGAIDFSRALCQMGKLLAYHVTICDARSRFATAARFPDADEVEIEWPHHYIRSTAIDYRTAIVVLTHDPKFDIPALREAVRTPAGYIGAMGSRRTHRDRVRRLEEIGMSPEEIARISSPIGLDIGGNTPEETAISIFAEIIALRSDRSGGRLTGGSQPIHRQQ